MVVHNIGHLLGRLLVGVATAEPAAVTVVTNTETNNGGQHARDKDKPEDRGGSVRPHLVDTLFRSCSLRLRRGRRLLLHACS